MQYLQSQPFTVGLGTKKYQDGWDRIFAKKQDRETSSTTEGVSEVKAEALTSEAIRVTAAG